ncbi:MAG: Transcriptional activator RfaH [Pedosphaera sp.]|nr:Transcriptional activator RfaH [Pedosphaera sp.]
MQDADFRRAPDCEKPALSLNLQRIKSNATRKMEQPNDQSYQPETKPERAWYCLRSKQKQEHIAAANLVRMPQLEVFNPRFRSRKVTRRGPAWVTESLFPNYLFVHFPFHKMLDEVRFTRGVSSVVRFGSEYPAVPAEVIAELRKNFPAEDLPLVDGLPRAGETVTITTRAMFGFQGVVLRSLPAKQRVQVLLEMLGQTTMMELDLKDVVAEKRALPAGLRSELRAA